MDSRYNLKVQKWITILSVVLFAAKIIAYYLTHSVAVLTDALESIVNVVAGIIGLYSLYVAAKPKDEEHPYGHGKAEFVSAAIEGTMVVGAGAIIIYETIKNIVLTSPVHQLDIGILLVSVTAILNYIAGAVCLSIGKRNKSLALQASGKHLQTDTWSTLAVVAGLAIIYFTKLFWIDKAIAIILAFYIMYNGYTIIRVSLAGIMDEQDKILLQQLVELLNKNKRINWIDLHNFRIIKYGGHLHIDCHLTIPWYLNVKEAHFEIDRFTDMITKDFGNQIEFFVHTDACEPFSCKLCKKEDCPVRVHPFEYRVEWTLDNLLTNQKHRL